MSNTDTIGRVWPVHLLEAACMSIAISMAIAKISSISRPLAIVVDTIAIRSMVVRTALVDERAGTAIISWLSRPLAVKSTISISAISVATIVTVKSLWASVSVADSMAVISWFSISGPLAVKSTISISAISVSTIVTVKSLWASVSVTDSMAVISWFSISGPLAISMSNVISIGVVCRVVAISMVSLGHIDRSSSISMTISIASLSLPLAIAIAMISMAIASEALGRSVDRATATIGVVGNTIARLSSSKAGKGCNNC